jgi:hypothetical protein
MCAFSSPQLGGPDYNVPLGRKNGLIFATREVTSANLPAPSSNASVILYSLGAVLTSFFEMCAIFKENIFRDGSRIFAMAHGEAGEY